MKEQRKSTPTPEPGPNALASPPVYQGHLLALEPRMLFDGAALTTAAEAVTSQPDPTENSTQTTSTDALLQAADALAADANIAALPTVTGIPLDITVVEGVASNFDLSGTTFADTGSNLVVTLIASDGIFNAALPPLLSGPIVTAVGNTVTLTGSADDINTYLDTASNIQYTSIINSDTTSTFQVLALDLGDPLGTVDTLLSVGSINTDTTLFNEAPVLDDDQSPVLTGVDEDSAAPVNGSTAGSTLVSALISDSDDADPLDNYSDAENADPGIAIIETNSNGTLYYSIDAGATWAAVGAVSETSARVLHADADTRLYFQPDADFNGSLNDILTFKAWDRTGAYANGEAGVDTTIAEIRLRMLGSYLTSGFGFGVNVVGDTAYAVDGEGLQIIDVSNPLNPTLLSTIATPGNASGSLIDGNIAYVVDGGSGIQIIDISDSSNPILLSTLDTAGTAVDIALNGNTAYVADSDGGLQIIDVSDPNNPQLLGTFDTVGTAVDVAVSDDGNGTVIAYVADQAAGLQIIDVSDPNNLVLLDTFDTPGSAEGITLDGSIAYIADGTGGLRIVDVSDPANPALLGVYNTTGTVNDVTLSGGTAYVTDDSGVHLIDISDPTDPTLLRIFGTPGLATGLTVDNNTLFITDSVAGLLAVNLAPTSFSVATDTVSVDVSQVNDPPTVTGVADVTVEEDTPSNFDLSGVTVADVDGDTPLVLTLEVSAGTFGTPADGSGVGAGVTAVRTNAQTITLEGSAADINTYLDTASNIQYTGALNVSGNDVATYTATVSDGAANSAISTANIDITAVNDAPTVTGVAAVTVTEDTPSDFDLSGVVVADVDGDTPLILTLTVAAGSFSTPPNGTGVTANLVDNQTITLEGSAADINTYLDTAANIQYTGELNVNGNAATTYTVSVSDPSNASASSTADVNITAENDAPTITLPANPSVAEDSTNNALSDDFQISDIDGDDQTVTLTVTNGTVSVTNPGGSFTFTAGDGTDDATMTFSGTLAEVNSALDSLTFSPTANFNGTATIQIATNDGNGGTATDTLDITVTAEDDAPTLGGAPADATVDEDVTTAIDLSAYDVADVDGDSLTLTLAVDRGTIASVDGDGTTDGVTIANSGTTGMTLQGTAADLNTYLNDTNNITYTTDLNDTTTATLTVTPSDGTADGVADTVTINVTPVNDAPTLGGDAPDATVVENVTTAIDLSAYNVDDVDSNTVTLTLVVDRGTIASVDGDGTTDGITIANSGAASMNLQGTLADLNTYLNDPSKITYTTDLNDTTAATLTVTPNDGLVDGAADTVAITVAAADAPTLGGTPADATVQEDVTTAIDLSAYNVADTDSTTVTLTLAVDRGTIASIDGDGTIDGVTIANSDSTAMTLQGTLADLNAYLSTQFRNVP